MQQFEEILRKWKRESNVIRRENWFKVTINTFSLDEFTDKWMYALVYDIDSVKKREIMLEQMAATDALTGLGQHIHGPHYST